jgi:hypothetical protein
METRAKQERSPGVFAEADPGENPGLKQSYLPNLEIYWGFRELDQSLTQALPLDALYCKQVSSRENRHENNSCWFAFAWCCSKTASANLATTHQRSLRLSKMLGLPMMKKNSHSPGVRLRKALHEEHPLQVVGVINAYAAILAERSGFKALYLSGAGVANASCGVPDIGITTLADVLIASARRCGYRLGQSKIYCGRNDQSGCRRYSPRRPGLCQTVRPFARKKAGKLCTNDLAD